jgi:hypothetical protein
MMNSYSQVPWTRNLAPQIDREFELMHDALRETRHRAFNAGKLLLEAMAQVPPLTGPEWISRHTKLSPTEAHGLICLAQAMPLLAEVEARASGFNSQQNGQLQHALWTNMTGPAHALDQWACPDDAVLEAQIELCRAVLDRLDATATELAAAERVLNYVQNRVAALMADVGDDVDQSLASTGRESPF